MPFEINGKATNVILEEGGTRATVDGKSFNVATQVISDTEFILTIDGRRIRAAAAADERGIHLWIDGETLLIRETADPRMERASGNGGPKKSLLTTSVPGKVIKVAIEAGSAVKGGDLLVVIEAMKMENQIRSPREGKIKAVHVAAGSQVNFGAKLVEFE